MKNKLVTTGYVLISISIAVLISALYWGREQNINFVEILPENITLCGNEINSSNTEYKEMITWLKNNKNGWVNSLASFIPITIYRASKLSINVMGSVVVINYTKNGKDWHQVVKGKRDNELLAYCKSS